METPNRVRGILVDPLTKQGSKGKKKHVVFVNLPKFDEREEEAKIIANRKKYKKEKEGVTISFSLKKVKNPFRSIQIKPSDPILVTPFNKYFLSD